jgi:hypothetical protein
VRAGDRVLIGNSGAYTMYLGLPALALHYRSLTLRIMGVVVMKRFHIIGRLAAILAGLAGIVVTLGAGLAPAALAGGDPHGHRAHPLLPAHAHQAVAGGMPRWQIVLIVAGAALLTAALAVLVRRVRAARRRVTVSTA